MRLQFIICKVIQREAYYCAARSCNTVDIVTMPQGLHDEPDKLRAEVQKALERTCDIQNRKYDATLLGYGLCSNGIAGLSCAIDIVVPRAHDCVTLLLGSKDRYQQYFDSHRGVYWYSDGWIDTSSMPGRERCERLLEEYRQKYGQDNAEYLMGLEQNWMKEYQWATYIDWGFASSEQEKKFTRECAKYMHWKYDQLKGDTGLLQRMVDGTWNKKEFLIVKPGQKICEDLTTETIIKAQ